MKTKELLLVNQRLKYRIRSLKGRIAFLEREDREEQAISDRYLKCIKRLRSKLYITKVRTWLEEMEKINE